MDIVNEQGLKRMILFVDSKNASQKNSKLTYKNPISWKTSEK